MTPASKPDWSKPVKPWLFFWHMGIWVLTGFDKASEELVLEAELPSLTLTELRDALGRPDDPLLDEIPLPPHTASLVARDLPDVELDFERVDYFMGECSVGPGLEWRDGGYLPPRALPEAFGDTRRAYPGTSSAQEDR